jgi:hypothetical protein
MSPGTLFLQKKMLILSHISDPLTVSKHATPFCHDFVEDEQQQRNQHHIVTREKCEWQFVKSDG